MVATAKMQLVPFNDDVRTRDIDLVSLRCLLGAAELAQYTQDPIRENNVQVVLRTNTDFFGERKGALSLLGYTFVRDREDPSQLRVFSNQPERGQMKEVGRIQLEESGGATISISVNSSQHIDKKQAKYIWCSLANTITGVMDIRTTEDVEGRRKIARGMSEIFYVEGSSSVRAKDVIRGLTPDCRHLSSGWTPVVDRSAQRGK